MSKIKYSRNGGSANFAEMVQNLLHLKAGAGLAGEEGKHRIKLQHNRLKNISSAENKTFSHS